ncbi:hypothetical protein E2562_036479 [Oryza meyeriana var. granulata]|uniref:Uncharacterized protein n=1 Tax=Oryza meyeriana var. granulata TaxID=110450 RepID=A0A6G1DTP5_9ORYZ|nr:hypothetical protein E2562_036479 [Oryza meyeriana var. granulata]
MEQPAPIASHLQRPPRIQSHGARWCQIRILNTIAAAADARCVDTHSELYTALAAEVRPSHLLGRLHALRPIHSEGPPLPPPSSSTNHLIAALATALHAYYPITGRFVTNKHPDGGCSISIGCDSQASRSSTPSPMVSPSSTSSLSMLTSRPSSTLSSRFKTPSTMMATIAPSSSSRLSPTGTGPLTSCPSLLKWWSPQGDGTPIVLSYADLSELIKRLEPPPLRERMLHISS